MHLAWQPSYSHLLHAHLLEGNSRMATLTLAAELTEVHIVAHVAGTAIGRQLDLGRRSLVAARTFQLGVRASQCETCRFAVIESPNIPAVAVVATCTVLTQATLVYIVGLMAAVAIGLGILELQREMALLAGHGNVQSHQRKIAEIMIETDFAAPRVGNMTLIALTAQLAGVCILGAMATDAGGAQFLRRHIRSMTSVATELGVRTGQRKLGIACMLKAVGLPLGAVMALLALLSHAPGMRVLRLVAAVTIFGDFVFHAPRGMAAHTIGSCMHAGKRKASLLGVIEFGGGPADRGMALLAITAA